MPETIDWVPDDAPGWETYRAGGQEWFQLYGASGGLVIQEIRYRINRQRAPEGYFDGRDLGKVDGPYVRCEVRNA